MFQKIDSKEKISFDLNGPYISCNRPCNWNHAVSSRVDVFGEDSGDGPSPGRYNVPTCNHKLAPRMGHTKHPGILNRLLQSKRVCESLSHIYLPTPPTSKALK